MDDEFLNPEGGAANISPLTNDPHNTAENLALEVEVLKGRLNELEIMLAGFFMRNYRTEGYTDGNGNLKIGLNAGSGSFGSSDGSESGGV